MLQGGEGGEARTGGRRGGGAGLEDAFSLSRRAPGGGREVSAGAGDEDRSTHGSGPVVGRRPRRRAERALVVTCRRGRQTSLSSLSLSVSPSPPCQPRPACASSCSFRATGQTSLCRTRPTYVAPCSCSLLTTLNGGQIDWTSDKATVLWEVIALSRTSDNGGTDCARSLSLSLPLLPLAPALTRTASREGSRRPPRRTPSVPALPRPGPLRGGPARAQGHRRRRPLVLHTAPVVWRGPAHSISRGLRRRHDATTAVRPHPAQDTRRWAAQLAGSLCLCETGYPARRPCAAEFTLAQVSLQVAATVVVLVGSHANANARQGLVLYRDSTRCASTTSRRLAPSVVPGLGG